MKKKIIIKEQKLKKTAGEKIVNATILDNKVYCSICNEHDYRISDYKLVGYKDQKLMLFTMRCKCGALNRFCSSISMKDEIHYIIDRKELFEIKEKGLDKSESTGKD